MKRPAPTRGFTIIEVVLFLAITGLMMGGVLVAVSGSINRQRYQDATSSVTDFMQGQYNLIDNVRSNRPADVACTAASGGGTIDTSGSSSSQPRGTSDCTIIGRYITTDDGRELVSQPIYATTDYTEIDSTLDEAGQIAALNLQLSPDIDDDTENHTVGWGTYSYTNANPTDTNFTAVLLDLGVIRTYISDQGNDTIANTVAASAGATDSFIICVAPDGLVSSSPLGVALSPRAANASGVMPLTSQEGETEC